ncbi:MAG: galactose mutarotase [Saprospiraceae bacterium]|nr:galactose mutarotase [Saprospiraceae bacterium]
MQARITKESFGNVKGEEVFLYILENRNGMKVSITNYGGIVTKIQVPDRDGSLGDVVLGFDSLKGYLDDHPYFGAIIGRYGNRIDKGAFEINEESFQLPINNDPNSLHGGFQGFDKKVWQVKEHTIEEGGGIELSSISKDGEEGYPGKLNVTVEYALTNDNELLIDYRARTDKPTVINLTNHSYFNLKGAGNGNVLEHVLRIESDQFTPVDETLIPTGAVENVKNTPFDFSTPKTIGERIDSENIQLQHGGGYDHNFVLRDSSSKLKSVAIVYEPSSGRQMEVLSTEPGVQFYTGNFLDGTLIGKGGKSYNKRYGFCLETQHFPDSPNQEKFPSTRLDPGEEYRSKTIYKFSIR